MLASTLRSKAKLDRMLVKISSGECVVQGRSSPYLRGHHNLYFRLKSDIRVTLWCVKTTNANLMPRIVYRMMDVLIGLVIELPIGTNLGLLRVLWALVSGQLLGTRGALMAQPLRGPRGLEGPPSQRWRILD